MDTGSNKQEEQWQLKGEEDSFVDYTENVIEDEYTTDYEPKKPASLKYIIIPIIAIVVFIGMLFLINIKARLGFIERDNIPAIDDLDGKKTENHFNTKDQRYVTIVVYGIDAHDITTSN
ncbi:MAG: hypothetical protein K6G26_12980, partial [Lachnospiraceae bacterium]|nr:hypothetical protein [Lachnospiraceae bacterium]